MYPMEWKIRTFEELTKQELYSLLQARARVFVEEQQCPYVDVDGRDQQAIHFWTADSGSIAAYVRILSPDNFDGSHASIGRVITAKDFRGHGLGVAIMKKAIDYCRNEFSNADIKISAQYYLLDFYSTLGFVRQGAIYFEDGIPHIAMIYPRR